MKIIISKRIVALGYFFSNHKTWEFAATRTVINSKFLISELKDSAENEHQITDNHL